MVSFSRSVVLYENHLSSIIVTAFRQLDRVLLTTYAQIGNQSMNLCKLKTLGNHRNLKRNATSPTVRNSVGCLMSHYKEPFQFD